MSKRKHKKAFKHCKPAVKVASPKSKIIAAPIKKLYWAYGSNLCVEQMKQRCPTAEPFAPLYLKDGLLTFRGYADVEARSGGVVAGGLWRIGRLDEIKLDGYEGVKAGLYEKRYLELEVNGVQERCLYYRMLPNEDGELGVMPPWDAYLSKIERGYKDFGLDRELLEEALTRAWGEKDKSADVMRRWLAAGKPKLARIAGSKTVQ